MAPPKTFREIAEDALLEIDEASDLIEKARWRIFSAKERVESLR